MHGGAYHDLLAIPARGGDLFDPDKFPFLEGRFGTRQKPIQVDNRTVLHLLESLQILQFKVPGGGVEPRRLSFKTIEVEQIGHVYEGLLDHRAIAAETTILGLAGTKNKEPEIALDVLEDLAAQGEGVLLDFLKKETGRSVAALKKLLPEVCPSPQPSPQGEGVKFPLASQERGLGGGVQNGSVPLRGIPLSSEVWQ